MRPEAPPTAADVHHRLLAVGAATDDPATVEGAVRRAHPLLPTAAARAVATAVTARATGLGALDAVLDDPAVTDAMVNGDGVVWVERHGQLHRLDLRLHRDEVDLLVERTLGPLGLRADRTAPLADARLPDGSRVNVVVPPLAVDGPCVTIRRFSARAIPLGCFCPPGVEELLAWAIAQRANLVVSGGTGAGKTTLLNALVALAPAEERIVTIEDTAELRLPGAHVVRLEARPATPDGVGAVSIRQLVRNALRMRPDRIVVGEVRGPEVADMLWAMNTGHEGSLSTCHASSPLDALRRLEVMLLGAGLDLPFGAVREQLHAAVDLVVQVERRPDGQRRVLAVAEVGAPDDLDGPTRIRLLSDPDGLRELPRRAPRRPGPPPDPRWCP